MRLEITETNSVSDTTTSSLFHSNIDGAEAKKGMMSAADEVIVLADHTKFDSQAMFRIAPIEEVDMIITDQNFIRSNYDIPERIKLHKAR